MARFRLGHDVMRALALDAKSCMIGRAFPDLCPAADGRRDGGMVVTAPMNDKRQLAGGAHKQILQINKMLSVISIQ